MKIPNSKRRKSLFLIDIQPAFINDRNQYILDNIIKLLSSVKYDLYVEVIFHAERGSIWEKQQNWIAPKDEKYHTVSKISDKLGKFEVIKVEKTTKSIFKGNKNILDILKDKNIEEIHLVGTETNDCIMASAFESFDFGFLTYVIEECCQSNSSEKLHLEAIDILRKQNLSNNSIIEKIEVKNI